MFTEQKILKIIYCAAQLKDKAIITLLWDIGARIGEIGTLKIKHIKFDEYGAIVNIKSKTGYRRVRNVRHKHSEKLSIKISQKTGRKHMITYNE